MKKVLLILCFLGLYCFGLAQRQVQCTFKLTHTVLSSSCSFPYCNGSYSLTALGGTPPYDWPSGTSFNTKDVEIGICPGGYSITVKDTAGCIGTATFTIGVKALSVDSIRVTTPPSCPTCCDGKLTAYPSGCSLSYHFQWELGYQQTISDSGVCAGSTYTFCVTDDNNNTVCDSIMLPAVPTSVVPLTPTSLKVILYPTQSDGLFTLRIDGTEQDLSVQVYNILGEMVFAKGYLQAQANNQIDITDDASGMYLYRILNKEGLIVSGGKLIIQK